MSLVLANRPSTLPVSLGEMSDAERIFCNIISGNLIPELQAISDKKVLEFYWQNFEIFKGHVDTETMFIDIYEYNYSVLREIASLYYDAGDYDRTMYLGMNRDDIIEELTQSEFEVNEFDYLQNLDEYVEKVLIDASVGFSYPPYHDVYSTFSSSEKVLIIHDSQNFLLPELYRVGFAGADRDCWDYMKTRVIPHNNAKEV